MDDWLAERFESHRSHLRAVAYRMLGSTGEADDAVQEAWLRLSRADTSAVDNLAGWLTTVVARVCLDMLRSRESRREEPLDERAVEPAGGIDPEREAVLADAVGPALLVVLDALAPAERLAFVLHDMFAVPFEDIAAVLGRSPAATRQLASRARRRVRGATTDPDPDPARRRRVVDAFLAASRNGDFGQLLSVLDPDVVLRADQVAVGAAGRAEGAPGLAAEIRGADAVARVFGGRARAARPALVDGVPGAVWAPNDVPRAVFEFWISDGRIVGIDVHADPARVAGFDVELI